MPTVRIDPRDKPGLLIAVMRAFEGVGQISLEGALSEIGLNNLPGASRTETPALRRATLTPELDFVVLPLTTNNIAAIWRIVVEVEHLADSNIIHVQVAVAHRFVFGAYDNFHRDCVVATDKFPGELLDRLVRNGVIRSYHVDAEADGVFMGTNRIPT